MLQRILAALTANVLSQVVSIAIQFMSIPLFIIKWGEAYYGEWLMLYTIPSYLSLSDVGIISSISNDLSSSMAKGNTKEALMVLSNGIVSVCLITFSCGLLLFQISTSLVREGMFNLKTISSGDTSLIIFFLIAYATLSIYQELVSNIYRAESKYAKGRMVITFTRFTEFLAIVAIMYFGGKAISVSIVILTIRLLALTFMVIDCYKRFYWVKFINIKLVDIKYIKTVISPSFSFLLFSGANILTMQGSMLLIATSLGTAQVVIYNTLRLVSNSVRQFVGIINSALWPEFTTALSNNNIMTAIQLHRSALRIAFYLPVMVIIFIMLAGKPLMHLWMGENSSSFSIALLTTMLVSALTYSIWNTSAITMLSINKHGKIAVYYFTFTAVSLLVSLLIIKEFGLIGITYCFIVSDLIMIYIVLKSTLHILKNERVLSLVKYVINLYGLITSLITLADIRTLKIRNR